MARLSRHRPPPGAPLAPLPQVDVNLSGPGKGARRNGARQFLVGQICHLRSGLVCFEDRYRKEMCWSNLHLQQRFLAFEFESPEVRAIGIVEVGGLSPPVLARRNEWFRHLRGEQDKVAIVVAAAFRTA